LRSAPATPDPDYAGPSAGHRARLTQNQPIHTLSLQGMAQRLLPSSDERSLIFKPITKPAVNDLPLLVANRTKIEKVGPFIL